MDQFDQYDVRRSERLKNKNVTEKVAMQVKTIASTSCDPDHFTQERSISRASSLHSARGTEISTSSRSSQRRLLEAQAARKLAELEQKRIEQEQLLVQKRMEAERVAIQKRMEAERVAIQTRLEEQKAQLDASSRHSSRSRSDVEAWIDQTNTACGLSAPNNPQGETPSNRIGDVAQLARAITDAIKTVSAPAPVQHHSAPVATDKLLGRISAKDLPTFSGDPIEWLRFKKAFETTTRVGQYSEEENVERLQRCLRGEAWAAVAARVITVTSADEILKTLEMRFGRPELVLNKIIGDIKKLPKLIGNRCELITLATKVADCVAAITATKHSEHLYNPDLFAVIIDKLTENLVYRWIDFSNAPNAANCPRLVALSDYLMCEANKVCKAGVVEMPPKTKTSSNIARHSVLVAAENDTSFAVATCSNCVNSLTFQKASPPKPETRTLCPFCSKDGHAVDSCKSFLAQDINKRWEWICNKKLCFKCFSMKHRRERCRSRKQCKTCNRGHHTLLHRDDWSNWINSKAAAVSNESKEETSLETTANVWDPPKQSKRILLKVLPVTVEGPAGSMHTCALLDEGSTISLVDFKVAQKIGAKGPKVNFSLQGAIGGKHEMDSCNVTLTLCTPVGTFKLDRVRTVDNLSLPSQTLHKDVLNKYSYLQDVPLQTYEDQPTLLIGQDYWQLIISREIRQGRMNEPVASRTMLGWVLHGFVSSITSPNAEYSNHLHYSQADIELHDLVKNYFRVDSEGVGCDRRQELLCEEQRALNILNTKSKRIGNKWETELLWRADDVTLPENKLSAMQRLYAVEKTMDADPAFARDYTKQVETLLERNYAEEVHGSIMGQRVWYLPHFGVRNPNKPGKLRLVHDARAETKGISLNTELLAGPDILNSLFGVLLRFRERPVAISGDIREMFMRVKINEEDQKSQLFLWRGMDRKEPPRTYKMTSMIFGAKSSPCTASYIIRRNAQDFVDVLPRAVKAIKERHYVDDYLDSVDTEQEMKQLVQDVTNIHLAGGFEIRGFRSNRPDCVPEQADNASSVKLPQPDTQRILGMIWRPERDILEFDLSFKKIDADIANGKRRPTKREMLQVIMSIFDPLGLLCPFLVRGKILLQQIWRSGVQWDETVGDTFAKSWFDWLRDLKVCQGFHIPRCYNFSVLDKFQLHVYVDASEQAYAAVAYLRRVDGEVVFVAGKSRVAPLKKVTIPRLELLAALMGTQLAATIQKEHDFTIAERFFWTDSQVVWHWIQNESYVKKSFVSNRLHEIRDSSHRNEWKWLPGELNVADEATRAKRHENVTGPYWIKGPDFLLHCENNWPKMTPPPVNTEENIEAVLVTHARIDLPVPDISRFSNWLRLIRSTACILLFVERLKEKSRVNLQSRHLDRAEQLWIMKSQRGSFGDDIIRLESNLPILKTSRLKNLSVYIDGEGILRLKGRIRAVDGVDNRMLNPVLLDGRHQFTRLLIQDLHEKAFHGNTECVINDLRQRFWVIHLRPTVKAIQRSCQFCRIRRARPLQPPTGDLPPARVAHHKPPFTHCGLDYFGPMTVSIGRRREKRYGALFTCMTTRAIHIELAGSLSTDSVIMALRRMMCRRGCPDVIYSDNGTNFRGALSELKRVMRELDQNELAIFLANKRIDWRFNPPLAPHMGGCWERLIGSVKRSLKAVLNEQAPREETLSTLLAEIEHTVNSRPLTHVSDAEPGQNPLTPNHFLIGRVSNVPWLGSSELVTRKCWRDAQRLADSFWKRWLREYLPSLLPRPSSGTNINLREGAMVLVVDPSLPRNVWPKGVVVKLYPGPDGVCRVADIRTVGGIMRRPFTKLIPI